MLKSLFQTVSWLNTGRYCLLVALLLTGIWCIGAIYYTSHLQGIIRIAVTVLFAFAILFLLAASWKGDWIYTFDLMIIELLIIGHFTLLSPQEAFRNVQWQKPWLHRPHITFNGPLATINFVRNFSYRTEHDYDVNYITMTIDMDKVTALDVVLSHWDGLENIAHTMISFAFSDGQYLAFSMETRLPEGTVQGMIPGLYKQYELLSIAGTEEDLFKLRTNYRKEDLYLYRSNATIAQCRMILSDLLNAINRQQLHPRFYNSMTHNCTTSMTPILRKIKPGFTNDIRLLFNGRSDEMLFEMGYLAHRKGESFAELKRRRQVSQYLNTASDYSTAIRTNLL
ncbi:MAG: DUF4105 domain-containing protein [Lentisphaerae bacterium]|nr:DUF4105 domain-containing protein [Lentisphaerota bacterium]